MQSKDFIQGVFLENFEMFSGHLNLRLNNNIIKSLRRFHVYKMHEKPRRHCVRAVFT